ncbi:uncharacterized protein LOC127750895 [Frankliniella occidentalis]|uniref:Uncharacterized protein LOC127750895 n=1 Tax=Frankliniella occidentalis TaxID=133901 RepID=A0A9C6XSL7_FRAOC|nr:uncharacterized protein LOC127750895 [Frankliniella occidentalis]
MSLSQLLLGDGLGLLLAAMGSAVDDFMLHQDTDSDEYVPKGVHIWETELHDFVVLYVVKDSDGAGGSSRDPADKKMGRHLQPLNTITYTVSARSPGAAGGKGGEKGKRLGGPLVCI